MQMIVAADSLSQEQARPIEADVIGAPVHVMRIATGEIEDNTPAKQGKEYARKGGLRGASAVRQYWRHRSGRK